MNKNLLHQIKIDKSLIGDNCPVFIVAELSANHLQDFNLAVKTIEAMKKSGADAVKLQTYTADTLTIDSNNKYFQIKGGTLWDNQTLHQVYQEAYTPWDWQPKLKKIAEKLGLACFSSPFDKTAVDFLEKMKVQAYKVASPEILDTPLIKYMASKGKPMLISTGIATLSDIEEAVNACRAVGNNQIILLKCTSAYPTPLEEVNLNTIPNLSQTFHTIVGLSDHSLGISVPIASIALGAKVIEKHFILDKTLKGPDSAFSLDPGEFSAMIKSIREVEKALGKICYELTPKMKIGRKFARSLFVVEDIEEGDIFTEINIRSIRPGNGLPPKYIEQIIGKKAARNLKKGIPLSWEVVS